MREGGTRVWSSRRPLSTRQAPIAQAGLGHAERYELLADVAGRAFPMLERSHAVLTGSWAVATIVVLSLTLLAAVAVPSQAGASGPKSEKAVFAHGTSPAGERWRASAGVRINHRAHKWQFDVEFKFSRGFGWGGGSEIPIGGRENERGEADGYTGILSGGAPESAAFGTAGPEVATIEMKMSDGGRLEIHPRFPPKALRRKFVWMRGFRYFIQFYPGSAYVSEYWLYDRGGRRVGCSKYAEGELGPSVCGGPPPFEG